MRRVRRRSRWSGLALAALAVLLLTGCQERSAKEAVGVEAEAGAGASLTGVFSLSFAEDHFQQDLVEVRCDVVSSPQGEVFHVTGFGEESAATGEPALNLRLPGVTVGQEKVYNRRLLPAFYGSATLHDVELRGATVERLELAAGPVPGSAESYECRLSTSLTEAWLLRCTDFAPLNWSVPGGRPLGILEVEFRCF